MYIHVYTCMLHSFYRFAQSIDCIAQSVDQQNACHSIECVIHKMRNAICRS